MRKHVCRFWKRRLPRRMVHLSLGAALIVLLPGQAYAGKTSVLLRSMLIPGTGQAQQGHYKKAAIFAGAFVASGFGLIVSQVHYNQSVDLYRMTKGEYQSFPGRLQGGEIINVNTIDQTYADMIGAFDSATDREKWRDGFAIALVTVYVVNIIDVLISKPHDPEQALNIELKANGEGVFLTRSFRF